MLLQLASRASLRTPTPPLLDALASLEAELDDVAANAAGLKGRLEAISSRERRKRRKELSQRGVIAPDEGARMRTAEDLAEVGIMEDPPTAPAEKQTVKNLTAQLDEHMNHLEADVGDLIVKKHQADWWRDLDWGWDPYWNTPWNSSAEPTHEPFNWTEAEEEQQLEAKVLRQLRELAARLRAQSNADSGWAARDPWEPSGYPPNLEALPNHKGWPYLSLQSILVESHRNISIGKSQGGLGVGDGDGTDGEGNAPVWAAQELSNVERSLFGQTEAEARLTNDADVEEVEKGLVAASGGDRTFEEVAKDTEEALRRLEAAAGALVTELNRAGVAETEVTHGVQHLVGTIAAQSHGDPLASADAEAAAAAEAEASDLRHLVSSMKPSSALELSASSSRGASGMAVVLPKNAQAAAAELRSGQRKQGRRESKTTRRGTSREGGGIGETPPNPALPNEMNLTLGNTPDLTSAVGEEVVDFDSDVAALAAERSILGKAELKLLHQLDTLADILASEQRTRMVFGKHGQEWKLRGKPPASLSTNKSRRAIGSHGGVWPEDGAAGLSMELTESGASGATRGSASDPTRGQPSDSERGTSWPTKEDASDQTQESDFMQGGASVKMQGKVADSTQAKTKPRASDLTQASKEAGHARHEAVIKGNSAHPNGASDSLDLDVVKAAMAYTPPVQDLEKDPKSLPDEDEKSQGWNSGVEMALFGGTS